MLFASAILPLTPTVTRERNRIAVLTKFAAGRACSATAAGSAIVISLTGPRELAEFSGLKLACTASILSGPSHLVQVLAGRRHHRGRDCTLDDLRVDETHVAVAPPFLEQVAHGQHGAAQVGEQIGRAHV